MHQTKESGVPVPDLEFHPLADPPARLEEIAREITARIDKLDKLGLKAVDHVDSIGHLLAEAEKLCGTRESFEAFKRQACPKLGKSRAYELLAIKDGRKSLEGTRAATRARVRKHGAAKRAVTEADSVTSDPQTKGVVLSTPINEPETPEASAEARKAECAASDAAPETETPQLSAKEKKSQPHVQVALLLQAEEAASLAKQFRAIHRKCPSAITAETIEAVQSVVEAWSKIAATIKPADNSDKAAA